MLITAESLRWVSSYYVFGSLTANSELCIVTSMSELLIKKKSINSMENLICTFGEERSR